MNVITSLVYRINDTIRYVSSIHWYDTRYVSRYVSYQLLNTNIADTVKLKSHMFNANNIEACIEHVCNISNRYFQKLPLAFRATQFVDNTFSANNLTCTMSRQLWHYYGSHQRTGLTLGPKLWLSVWSEFHVQCTSTSQCYQKMENKRIEFTLEEDPLLNMCTLYRRHNQLN